MCTAISFTTKDHYFGRTLDLEHGYSETVTVTPRRFPLSFRLQKVRESHLAIIGMATVAEGYPLYYEAVNEKGLCMAGLNFVQSSVYFSPTTGKINLASFELIPWILGQCETLDEVRDELKNICVCDISFSRDLKATPLHWMISDKSGSITVESVADGLRIYENPVGVLTNEPPFPYQMARLADYKHLSAEVPKNTFAKGIEIATYSRGMGAIGLPGDLSSASRFVRAAFVKCNSVTRSGEGESVSQFFHILGSVEQQRGCVSLGEGAYVKTRYTSCINADRGIYYYTTYSNHRINAVDMHKEDLDGDELQSYPLNETADILWQN